MLLKKPVVYLAALKSCAKAAPSATGLAFQPPPPSRDGRRPEKSVATDSRVYDEFDRACSNNTPCAAKLSMNGDVLRAYP